MIGMRRFLGSLALGASVALTVTACDLRVVPVPPVSGSPTTSATASPTTSTMAPTTTVSPSTTVTPTTSTVAPTRATTSAPATTTTSRPAPSATTTVSPAPEVPVGRRLLFSGNYDTGDFSQWETVQNRLHNGSAGSFSPFYGMQVLDGGPGHETAARYEVRDGDIPDFGGGERAEVSGARDGVSDTVREGDERWYEFSLMFPEDFRNPRGGWFIVAQWHSGSGSPPLTVSVSESGTLVVQNDREWGSDRPIGAVRRGVWTDYVLRVKFSNSSSVGYAEVWQDGRLVLPKHARRTMASNENYLKMGIYRDADDSGTAVVWHDGLRISAP